MSSSASAILPKGVKLAYSLAVVNAVVIGITYMFVKLSLDYTNPLDTLTLRFAAAFAILSIMATSGLVKLNYRGKPLSKLLMLSCMFPLGYFTLQTYGLQFATSAEGGIINALAPLATLFLASVFLKEATSRLQKLSIILSVFGVVFIFIMKGNGVGLTHMKGILLLLLACVAFAGYSVLARSVSKYFSTAEISFFMVGIGFAVSLVFSLALHLANGSLGSLTAPLTNMTFLLLIVYLGLVQVVTALMGNYILSRIEASRMSAFINLSTVVSIAAGAWILSEPIAWYHLVGSALIIVGVIGTNLRIRKEGVVL
ncbi:DMT family transporter [Paenibacillus nasutitermitis]|uniref:Transporter YcxC n=1 Tax=Paenibacillus nasutitermitis TaxID=1652958 RepID=A0A917E170_9BACL|nr:DMT family transporter [Paenibacillus nasutitermitis]GGD88331.1 putative transporter YcxC [Paenibacillus nasutitermitis]